MRCKKCKQSYHEDEIAPDGRCIDCTNSNYYKFILHNQQNKYIKKEKSIIEKWKMGKDVYETYTW